MARAVLNTKHFRVSELLSEQFRSMSPGEMIPTVAELKHRFDSSQATITQALDRLRQRGVIERPAGRKRLIVARGGTPAFRVTLIRPLWASPDYDAVTNRIYELGQKENFGFGVYVYSNIEEFNIEQVLHNSDAGLVLSDLNMSDEIVKAFNGSRKPIVFLRDKPPTINRDLVWVDDYEVGRMATQYLQKLGHSRILVMLSEPANPSSEARMRGWHAALQARGVKKIESLVCDCSVPAGHEAISGSYEIFSTWLGSHPRDFTAIFCVGWTGALSALRALREHQVKVPEDVSVITYASESPLCDFTYPRITTLQMNLERYTTEAIRLIRKNLKSHSRPPKYEEMRLDPHLVLRESTRKIG